MSWWDEVFSGNEQQFYGPTNEELGYVPLAQPSFFESAVNYISPSNIWDRFTQSEHLKNAMGEISNLQEYNRPSQGILDDISQLPDVAATGFKTLQEIGRSGFGDALGLEKPIQVSEDIISTPYRGLGMLADVARSGGLEESNLKAITTTPSILQQLTGSDVQAPMPADISLEGLKALGAGIYDPSATLPELSQIALGEAEKGDVSPIVEQGIRSGSPIASSLEDIVDPAARVLLQIGLDPSIAALGPLSAEGSAGARVLQALNLPSDVMDVVETSGQFADVGRESGWTSPEAVRSLSQAIATAGLTGAEIAPELLNLQTPAGADVLDISPKGREAETGAFEYGRNKEEDLFRILSGEESKDPYYPVEAAPEDRQKRVLEILAGELGPEAGVFKFGPTDPAFKEAQDKVTEDLINRMRPDLVPAEALPNLEIDPIQQAFQESQANALQAKIDQLQSQGFGEETIGGLTPDQANALISAQTPRNEFKEESYEDKIQTAMRQNNMSREFAEELLASEGILPDLEPNIVFHGSPYDFEQFDLSKIGTGEGAQAYGHGFYFAENPEVAADYSRKLSRGRLANAPYWVNDAREWIDKAGGDRQKAMRMIEEIRDRAYPTRESRGEWNQYDAMIDAINRDEGVGKVYSASIPQPDEFIDLDKPISQQMEPFNKIWTSDVDLDTRLGIEKLISEGATGQDILGSLRTNVKSEAELAEKLRGVGIKGISYLDQGSRLKPLKNIKNDFLKELPQDASVEEVRDYIGTGKFNPNQDAFLEALDEDDWLGFDYPSQAISAALTDLSGYAPSPKLRKAVDALKEETQGTRNAVVFDPKDIKILEKTKEIDREKLAAFVANVKQKYGQRSWRNKMTPKEQNTFNDLQVEATKPVEPEIVGLSPEPKSDVERVQTLFKRIDELQKQGLSLEDARKRAIAEDTNQYNATKIPDHIVVAEYEISPEEIKRTDQAAIRQIFPLQSQQLTPPPSLPPITQPPPSNLPPIQPPARNIPPSPPAQPPKRIPPTPPKPESRLKPLSAARSVLRSTIENLKYINPEIGRRVEAYDQQHSVKTSQDIYKVREATQGLTKQQEVKIVNFLDGQKVQLNPKEMEVAKKLRSLLDDIANRADTEGVLVGYREGYFPRKYEDKFEWDYHFDLKDLISKSDLGSMPSSHLEKARKGKRMDFRRDFKVLEEYANEAERRIAEARFLGKDPSKLIENFRGSDRNTLNYLRTALKRVTGREFSTRVSKAGDVLRRVVALGDLTRAAIFQPAQITHTASAVGFRRAIKATWELMKGFKREKLEATRSGALWPNINHEVSKALGDKGYMHGIPTLDKVMRIHANIAGRILYRDALSGSKYANEQLSKLGLNRQSGADAVGKAISDKTQFRTGTLDMPLWSHSPAGKMITQYSSFAYGHAKFMRDMFKHPVDNFGQILRFGGLGILAAGESVAGLRAILDSLVPGDDEDDDLIKRGLEAVIGDDSFDDKEWTEKLRMVVKNRRIPFTSPSWRALQNFSMIGGVGIFQNILERLTSKEDIWKIGAGPALSETFEFAQGIKKDIEKGEFRETPKQIIGNLPIPGVSPWKIANMVIPPKKRKSSGFLPDLDPIGNVLPNF